MMLLGKGGKALCIDATITPRFSTLLNPDRLLTRHIKMLRVLQKKRSDAHENITDYRWNNCILRKNFGNRFKTRRELSETLSLHTISGRTHHLRKGN